MYNKNKFFIKGEIIEMKKITVIILAVVMLLSAAVLASCGDSGKTDNTTTTAAKPETTTTAAKTEASASATATQAKNVMSYAEYAAADMNTAVVVETYIQAKQSWWDNKAIFYTQDEDGAYFVYQMPCSEEEYAKLTKGTKIRVSGTKSEWNGEVEIVDATYEILEGSYEAAALDVTALLGTEDLIKHQNEFVAFKGMKVEPIADGDGNEAAFLYNWDGSGEEGSDLYFKVSANGVVYTFTVESYLCDKDSDVYKAVKELKIGDVIDMEGFLYWYNGVNPHITSVKAA